MNTEKKLVDTIIEGIQEKKGYGIVIADLSKIDGSICKYFVICHILSFLVFLQLLCLLTFFLYSLKLFIILRCKDTVNALKNKIILFYFMF